MKIYGIFPCSLQYVFLTEESIICCLCTFTLTLAKRESLVCTRYFPCTLGIRRNLPDCEFYSSFLYYFKCLYRSKCQSPSSIQLNIPHHIFVPPHLFLLDVNLDLVSSLFKIGGCLLLFIIFDSGISLRTYIIYIKNKIEILLTVINI